jgi:hypothetical protein
MPIQVDPSHPTEWEITISHLKIGVYQAAYFDPNGTLLQEWKYQRTDDSQPDRFAFNTGMSLPGGHFWFQAVVIDPAHTGGPFDCTINVLQKGAIVGSRTYSGNVPSGAGLFGAASANISLI